MCPRSLTQEISRAIFVTTFAMTALMCGQAQAQSSQYPTKPIRIVVPFTTGGSADTLARILGQKFNEAWGQQVIVDNRGGAGGTIGMEAAKRMPADGYTFVLISSSQAVSHVLYRNLTYDITKDFTPVSLTVNSPMLIASNPRISTENFRGLMTKIMREPGKLSYASCGVGTSHHLAMEILKFKTGAFIVHVPYRGCSPAVADAAGGQIDIVIATASTLLPFVRSGKLRALAITDIRRAEFAPDVPTVAESGIPSLRNFDVGLWLGFMAPLGTPADIVAKFNAEIRRTVLLPELQQKYNTVGLEPRLGDAKELMTVLDADIRQYKQVVEFAKITPE